VDGALFRGERGLKLHAVARKHIPCIGEKKSSIWETATKGPGREKGRKKEKGNLLGNHRHIRSLIRQRIM